MKKLRLMIKKDAQSLYKSGKTSHARVLVYLYLAYISIILVTKVMPIVADTYIDSVQNDMEDEYTYHLRFPHDGYQSHYYVERWNKSAYGIIDLTYHTPTHTLEVKTANIMVLEIDSRSMYEDEGEDISGKSPYDDTNLYKKYFIERDLFSVNIITLDNRQILNLSFRDIPIAYQVRVNGETWTEGTDYLYTSDHGMVISNVPSGSSHVEIWFESPGNTGPTAIVDSDKITGKINELIFFDASSSHDDTSIVSYYWDFGEGNFSVSDTPYATFSYAREGNYSVILTVKDEDSLIDRAYISVNVIPYFENHQPMISRVIPNQEQYEDCPPWTLNLGGYGMDLEDSSSEFRWFVTGENSSLYSVTGENTTDILTFIPAPDSYGNDEITIWLIDTSGAMDSQVIWVNITPVNDKPYFDPFPPNLIVHYYDSFIYEDDPYTWDYTAYMHDLETETEDLVLSTSEPTTDSGNGYINVDGMKASFFYPYDLLGSSIIITLTISDGYDETSTVISVKVSSNWAPRLLDELPDISMEENSTVHHAFDLDDYFWDRDNDTLFYATGFSNLEIEINEDHTVDFIAPVNWFGTEMVTFRAHDPTGAIIEDTVVVTVRSVNDPPSIIRVPDIMVHYDYTYSFDLAPYVEDKDNSTDELLLWTSEPTSNIWVSTKNNMHLMFNYPESRNGDVINVTIWISDGVDQNYHNILVSVTDNYPPELAWDLPDVMFREDEVLNNSLTLDYYFIDFDSQMLYYSYGYTYLTINIHQNSSVDFIAPPNWYGEEKVTFRATDRTGAIAEDTITVTVIPENDPPIIGDIPDQWANEGDTWVLDLSGYISDIDNELNELEVVVYSSEDEQYINISGLFLIFQYPNGVTKDTVTVVVGDGISETYQTFSVTIINNEQDESIVSGYLALWAMLGALCIISFELIGYKIIRDRFKALEIFLIHNNGLLIGHCTADSKQTTSDPGQSGMLIAGMNLIRDSFGQDGGNSDNKDINIMGKSLLVEKGQWLYILTVHTGKAKNRTLEEIRNIMDDIERTYGRALEDWMGDLEDLEGIEDYLAPLL